MGQTVFQLIITVTTINAIRSCGKIHSQSPVNDDYKLIKMPSAIYVCRNKLSAIYTQCREHGKEYTQYTYSVRYTCYK